jgi:hypothetical protein
LYCDLLEAQAEFSILGLHDPIHGKTRKETAYTVLFAIGQVYNIHPGFESAEKEQSRVLVLCKEMLEEKKIFWLNGCSAMVFSPAISRFCFRSLILILGYDKARAEIAWFWVLRVVNLVLGMPCKRPNNLELFPHFSLRNLEASH